MGSCSKSCGKGGIRKHTLKDKQGNDPCKGAFKGRKIKWTFCNTHECNPVHYLSNGEIKF